MRRRQKKRSRCIARCAAKSGGQCNCSAKVLRLGHMQQGDVVVATLVRDSGSHDLRVVVMGDIGWVDERAAKGCIPADATMMTRVLDDLGPHLMMPAMSPVVKVLDEYSPRVLDDGDTATDPLGGR